MSKTTLGALLTIACFVIAVLIADEVEGERQHWLYRQDVREAVGRLKAENSKLRKLVAGKIYCWHPTDGCKGCPLYRLDDDGWCDEDIIEEELGFGVNE